MKLIGVSKFAQMHRRPPWVLDMGNFGFVLTPIDSNESPYRFYIWRKLIAAIDRSSSGIQNR